MDDGGLKWQCTEKQLQQHTMLLQQATLQILQKIGESIQIFIEKPVVMKLHL
jgi:hypothetical protein